MKKILAVLTVIVMLGCMLSVTAFADGGYVPSPKHDDEPGTTPTSPQTGYDLGIGSVVMAIAVSRRCGLRLHQKGPHPGITKSIQ